MASSKDRERELARRRLERRQQRIAQQRAARRRAAITIAAVVAAVLALVGIGALVTNMNNNDDDKKPGATATGSTGPATCTYNKTTQPASKDSKGLPPSTAPRADSTATIEFNRGTVKVALLGSKAPCAVNSFEHLAAADYFNGTSCHRITDSGVVQCGDPTAQGSGGPGYQFLEENLPTAAAGAPYPVGTLAMAKSSAPGSSGSQFFIVTKDNTFDGPNYTIFGKVTSGLNILESVIAGGSTPAGDGKPNLALTIKSVKVAA